MEHRTGRLLRVDLSTGRVTREMVDEQTALDFVGGRGFGINYLYREVAPGTEPLSEKNKLILVNGVLAGSSVQAVARWMAITKSPLTGTFFRSVAGADFGAWLKFAGYDLIIIEGKAEKPVYIHLTADGCQILDAGHLWGKDTRVTQQWLSQQYGQNTRTACIGPAGENLVRYSAIVSGRRTAGRGGTGTVMGSKNLKAIAITAQRSMSNESEALRNLIRRQVDIMRTNKAFIHHKEMGTTETQDVTNRLGIFPVKNYRLGKHPDHEKLTGAEYRKLRVGEFGCYSCAARCGKAHLVTSGAYKGATSEGPEYETIWSFSAPIENSSIEATIAADEICDDMGLDTISTGACIGFVYELYERGILKKKDVDGLELSYGNHESMLALVRKIALREGIGNLLAEGTARAAATLGAEYYAMHVKGLDLPAYDPRGAKSQGYNYVTSNIGASHCFGYARQEIFGATVPRPVDRFAEAENADIVIYNQNLTAMGEVGIICSFSQGWGWFPEVYGKMLAAVTGVERLADLGYLTTVGERIFNLERAFNVREGFSRSHDNLPKRITSEPLVTGGTPGEGQVVRELDKFLDRYYQLRGWTKEGVPSAQKLKELNLGSVLEDMAKS
ncbi:MAG: aldehyde ferredoxin oxidoreductase family protein [Dehalococcoidia bacterium]|nr:aldehyde ferredoxin oxidoreductase family protein [Dehalococcoidia bacterium]